MSLVGHHIGRYRILEELGSGGMSVVYKGLDTALDREVAIKVLHPHLASQQDSRRRLALEAKAVAKLHHPNILEVFDFAGVDSENAYIVTEYIRGQTLKHFVEERAFHPPEIAAMVIHEVATALACAHEAGIIHRDLKPENVMIREDGVIKLMDFGIAKVLDREDKMTTTGALVGSPAHMAPEIIEGHEAGPEADVFSLGTMLYYFATARLPFSGPNASATLKKILDGRYDDPRSLQPAISDELATVIGTCLARQASSRYPGARSLAEALGELLAHDGFSRPSEELGWFFLDPNDYSSKAALRLTEQGLARARQLVSERRPAKALACLNQVLALDPTNSQARQLLSNLSRAQRRRKLLRRGLMALTSVSGAVVLGAASYAMYERSAKARASGDPVAQLKQRADVTTEAIDGTPQPGSGQGIRESSEGDSPTVVRAADQQHRQAERQVLAPAVKKAKPPPPVKLTVQFRPYAYAQIDDAPSKAEMTQHEFLLPPGTHHLVYGCHFCEEENRDVEVKPGAEPLRLLLQPKPSLVRFEYQPADAMVSIAGATLSAGEARSKPFRIDFPRGVTQQRIWYEISRAGYKTTRELVSLAPGESRVLEGSLVPE
jgi:serine/threonine-protein kinase